jgi:hypothetical protein
MSDLNKMQNRALQIASFYDESNQQAGRPSWGPSEYMSGLVGDIGDLSKLVMAHEGLREIADVEAKIDHELNDILWSYLVLCKQLGRAPGDTFYQSMDELEARFPGDKK